IGLPSVQSAIASSRLTSSANDIVVALQGARSQSIRTVKFAGVSIDTSTTPPTWYSFLDSSTIGAAPLGSLIQNFTAASGVTLVVTSTNADASDDTPTYRPDGRLGSVTAITMELSTSGSSEQRRVYIEPSGRVGVCVLPAPNPATPCPH
ncbi:MAG: GspH/FimT family pseudopilin, partial [Methylococcales bacterium]|nr:GspH/FimT family pseudopilin [Methylococcales bacterium]